MSAAPAATAPPFSRATLAGDAWGGFAAMLVAVPSSIAFGVAVFGPLGADYVAHGVRAGLIGAVALGLVTAGIGGASRLVSAPCAPAAAVLSALVSEMLTAGTPPARAVALLAVVALLSAALQLLYGALRGGRLIKFIPYPVVAGYLSAVGVILFLGQLPKFLGAAATAPAHWQAAAILVGAATVAGMLLAPKLTRTVPAAIVGLAVGLLAYAALAFVRPELRQLAGNTLVIGPVATGGAGLLDNVAGVWSGFGALGLADLRALAMPALTLSVLLSVDALKTCVVVDALARTRHDSNRVLLGQGAGNLAAALLGGMAGSGTMGATLVNAESGGRTRLSGALEGAFVLLVALALGRWLAWVPVAALAGILLVVAARMFDWGAFQLLRQRDTALDFAVIATVVVVAVAANLIAAAGAGIALAIALFLREQVRASPIRRKVAGDRISSTQHREPAELAALERAAAQSVVCELQGSLFFGTTDRLLVELEPDLARCRYLVLDLRRVTSVDFTAAHLLERFERTLAEREGWLLFSRVPAHLPTGRNLRVYFARIGVMSASRRVRVCESLDDAVRWVEDRIIAEALPARAAAAGPLALADFDLLREFAADDTLAALASCATERRVPDGGFVFRNGDPGSELCLVRRGIVRVALPLSDGSHHNLASFGPGSFFGEMAFLAGGGRSADAIAAGEVELFAFSREKFDALSRAHPAVGAKFFARLARALALHLRRTDAELRALYEA